MLQTETPYEWIASLYNWLVFAAPVIGLIMFLSFLAGWILWIVSDKGKLAILSFLSRVFKRLDKSVIGQQCAVFMKPRIRELSQENPEAALPLLRLAFTKTLEDSVSVDEKNQVIILLKESKNKAENLLRIANAYVTKGVLHGARRIVTSEIKQAVEVTVMHRLLKDVDSALRLWDEHHYQPCISEEQTRVALEKVYYMDRFGYLTRMFLSELELVSRRLGVGVFPEVVLESKEWLSFAHEISQKHDANPVIHNRDVPLVLRLPNIAVGVIMVARSWILAKYGTDAHEARLISYLGDPRISEIYIIGWGEENCYQTINLIGKTYLKSGIAEIYPTLFRAKSRGMENQPVVLARYVKGPLQDEHELREQIRRFMKEGRKELKRVYATVHKLLNWFEKNEEKCLGTRGQIKRHHCDIISRIMHNEDMTMDALDYIFESPDLQDRLERFLGKQNIPKLHPKDQVLYRIYAALGLDDREIMPRLDPRIFMKGE